MRRMLMPLLAVVVSIGCDSTTEPSGPETADAASPSFDIADQANSISGDLIEGRYVVLLSPRPARSDVRAEAALEAITEALGRQQGARVRHTYRYSVTGFAADLTHVQAEELRADPRVVAVEQDSYLYPTTDPAVQEYPTWGLDRMDQRARLLDRAYVHTATGSGVTAYIIDSGIRYSHEEFRGRAALGYDFALEEDPGNTDPTQGPGEDCRGHGTHVAGTVGGTTHGVAKDVALLSVRVFGCTGGAPRSRVIAAVDWVTQDVEINERLPAVVNMSLAGGYDPDYLAYAESIGNSTAAGVNFAVAAGNAGADACGFEPAQNSAALTVGASTIGDDMASFSNYGECVDLFAPGVGVTSAWHTDDAATYSASGTSMSAPHVAGLVSLYVEANPAATSAEVLTAIVANATPNAVSGVPSGTSALAHSLWGTVEFTPPAPPEFGLSARGRTVRGEQAVDLSWVPTGAFPVQIYRDGTHVIDATNNGEYQDLTGVKAKANATYVHHLCELYYDNCSSQVTTIFGDGGGEDPPAGDAPVASFDYSCDNSHTCQFTDTSTPGTSEITAWVWSASEGQSADTQHTSFTFATEGSYTVTLGITDGNDLSDEASKSLTCTMHRRHGLRCS